MSVAKEIQSICKKKKKSFTLQVSRFRLDKFKWGQADINVWSKEEEEGL